LSSDEITLQVPPSIQEASNWQNTGTFEQTQATAQANSAIARDLLNNNVNRILQSEKKNGGSIAGAADRLQNSMQTNVSFGGSDPAAIHHSVRVKLNAAQGQAVMNYSGLLDAQLSYSVGPNSGMREAITQKLDDTTSLIVENTSNHTERVQRVSLSFGF